ncbi:MAG: DUF3592 domain-containing protein [Phycisphaerales bacterium]
MRPTLVQLFCMLTGPGLMLVALLGHQRDQAIMSADHQAEARVVSSEPHPVRKGPDRLELTVEHDVDGHTYTGQVSVSEPAWRNAGDPATVTIQYDRDDPSHIRLPGQNNGWVLGLAGVVLTGLGLLRWQLDRTAATRRPASPD